MGGHGTVVGQTSTMGDFYAKVCEQRALHASNFGSATPQASDPTSFTSKEPFTALNVQDDKTFGA